jgi:hypothetical protein
VRPAILAIAICLFARTAAADNGWCGTKVAELYLGGGLFAAATRYADQPTNYVGGAVEVTIAYGDWQVFGEGAIAAVRLGEDKERAGTLYRGALGVRYIARRFVMRDPAVLWRKRLEMQLGFEVLAGGQDIDWKNAASESRPELDVGVVWNFVFFDKIASRTSLRVFMTPAPTSEAACRGPCPESDRLTSGFMVLTGVVW